MIAMTNPTGRKTECRWVNLGGVSILFSYETPVAYRTNYGEVFEQYRVKNTWGPTTGRHINEASVRSYPELSDDEFDDKLHSAIARLGMEWFKEKFK